MLARFVGRTQKYADMFKEGLHEVPHLYLSISLGVVATIGLIARVAHTPPGGYITRFKERYMIMRPDDERLIGYPKEYVTDRHLLK